LQAGLDYANGLHATAFTSMTNQFDGVTARSSGGPNGGNIFPSGIPGSVAVHDIFVAEEALCGQYVGARYNGLPNLGILHYEGGPQWGPWVFGQDNGSHTDIAGLVGARINLNWDLSPYTQTGTNHQLRHL
jgi:hypothetical protein